MPSTDNQSDSEIIRNAPLTRAPRYHVALEDGRIVVTRRDGQACGPTDLGRVQFVDRAADLLRILKLYISGNPSADSEAINWAQRASD